MATIGESSPVQVESIAVNKPDLTLDIESRPPPHHVGSVGEDCALSAKWSVGDPDADVADTCPIDDVTWRAGTCILPKSSDIDMAPALTPGSDMQHAFQRIRITSVSENEVKSTLSFSAQRAPNILDIQLVHVCSKKIWFQA